jgi:hypothetical protein
MLTEVAPVVCHDKVEEFPEMILVGLAEKLIITGGCNSSLTLISKVTSVLSFPFEAVIIYSVVLFGEIIMDPIGLTTPIP